ncbi:hypothetical protein [uncultured Lutibacter sp.]|uniref:hypothetical protein n=1 Tax=uncultured Lutibacter sp. TaxID=437739 RepID=UPI002627F360|nr:hypothetical protein [uncultured Lutibacter sp.]
MYNFTDLIIRAFIEYTIDKEDNIALFFYQAYYGVRKTSNASFVYPLEKFFDKLNGKLDQLINTTYHNHYIDPKYFEDVNIDYASEFAKYDQDRYEKQLRMVDESGANITVERINWEECRDPKILNDGLDNWLDLKDPVRIITPNKEIYKKNLVIRKSELVYLKKEADRAFKVNNLEILVNNPVPKYSISNSPISPIRQSVIDVFNFAIKIRECKGKIISDEDYQKLINGVTTYFESGFTTLPKETPIVLLKKKGNVTYIRYAFKLLIDKWCIETRRPKSFYSLISKCFEGFNKETPETIQKTSKPYNWGKSK